MFPILALLGCTLSTPSHEVNACASLDQRSRSALKELADRAYRVPGQITEDGDAIRIARKNILDKGSDVLPCLLYIYEHGLVDTKLWSEKTAVPTSGQWSMTLIREIDPAAAVRLYRKARADTGDSTERFALDSELAILGDREYLEELVAFLAKLVKKSNASAEERLQQIQRRALEGISVAHYRPALKTLQQLQAQGWKNQDLLRIYIAQLSDDVPTLRNYVDKPFLSTYALVALKRMGQEDLLRSLSTDQQYAYRDRARAALDGTLTP